MAKQQRDKEAGFFGSLFGGSKKKTEDSKKLEEFVLSDEELKKINVTL